MTMIMVLIALLVIIFMLCTLWLDFSDGYLDTTVAITGLLLILLQIQLLYLFLGD